MQSNRRFYGILGVVLIALLGLWLFIRGGKSAPEPTTQQAATDSGTKSSSTTEAPEEREVQRPLGNDPHGDTTNRAAVTTSSSKTGDGVIAGIAKDESGDPVMGATVQILPIAWKHYEARPDDAVLKEATTDVDGKFSISGLPVKTGYGVLAMLGPLAAIESTYLGEKEKKAELSLTLTLTNPIAGTVVDTDGNPVPGAALYAAHWQGQGDQLPINETEVTRQLTDESGAFRFPHVPPGNFKFLVKSKEFAPLVTDWVPSGTEDAHLVLRKGGSIAGRVVYAQTREPARKIKVVARTNEYREEKQLESDADGAFSFANLRDTSFDLTIDSETLTVAKLPEKIKLSPGQAMSGIEIEIDKGAAVSGFVRNGKTGKGIAKASIQLYQDSRGGERIDFSKDATSDEDGAYTIAGLPAGNYALYLNEAVGYVRDNDMKRQIVSVSVGQSLEDINFTLDAGTTIAGQVLDETGAPVADARVNAALQRGGRWASAQSDSNGLFTIEGVSAGPNVFVKADKKGMVSAPVGPFDVTSNPAEDVTVVLTKEASIAGVVVDETGKPVPDAQVIPWKAKDQQDGFGMSIERTDAKGEFRIGQLSEGEYQLQAQLGNRGWRRNSNAEKIRLAAGEAKTGVKVLVEGSGGLSISGRVTGEDGKPVRNAQIWASGTGSHADSQSDSDGKYKVAGLKEGTFSLQVQANGYTQQNKPDVPAGSENVDVVLQGTGKIEGRIIDAATGQPVTDFEIVYAGNAGMDMRNFTHAGPGARTRSEVGAFLIDNVQAGTAAFLVRGQGYAPKIQQVADIVPGQTVSGVIVEVEAGGSVEGRVLDGSGKPLAGAQLFDGPIPMNDYRRERSVRATSASDGSFTLDGLPLGSVTISAVLTGYAASNVQIQTRPGQVTQADIILGSGGTVRILVTENGAPASNAYAGIQATAGSDSTAKNPDANGITEYTQVAPGEYRAYAGLQDPDGDYARSRNQGREFTVTEGNTTELAFDFAAGTASLAGTVTKDGQPPKQAWAELVLMGSGTSGEESRHIQIDASGQFQIENLPPGQSRLTVTGMVGENQTIVRQVTVDLSDGQTTDVTVDLSGGGGITGTVSGLPPSGNVSSMLLRGSVDIPLRPSREDLEQWHRGGAVVGGALVDRVTGAFTFPGVEEGQYTVVCSTMADNSGQIRCAATTVTVTDNETTTVALTFPQ